MTPQDAERLGICLAGMAEVYGRELSEAVVGLWLRVLDGYRIEAIEDAFERHIKSPDQGQFMPKPADILRMLDGSSEDAALIAWTKVDKAVRSIGAYQSVAFDDAIIHRVLHDMGGWIGLGTKTDDEWPFVANEFRNRYRGYRLRGAPVEYPGHLIGIVEAENSRNVTGEQTVYVVYVGDTQTAKDVAARGSNKPLIGFSTASAQLSRDPNLQPRLVGKPRLETVQ